MTDRPGGSPRRRDRRWRRPIAVLATAATATALLAVASFPAQAESVGTASTVYTVGTGDSLRAPTITAIDATHLVTGWRDQADATQDDAGDALVSYSADGGSSWSTAQTIKAADSQWSYVNSILYTDTATGTVYDYIGRVPAGGEANDMRLIAMKSTDQGHTWSDVPITIGTTDATITGGSVVKVGSTYYLPVTTLSATTATDPCNVHADGSAIQTSVTVARLLTSTDLVHWSVGGATPHPSNIAIQEGQLAVDQTDPSVLVEQFRTQCDNTYRATSSDGGATWTTAVEDTAIPSGGSKTFFGKGADGTDIAIYGPTNRTGSARRQALFYKTKRPGEQWGPERFFADQPITPGLPGFGPGWDCYANAVEISPGVWKVVWEYSTAQPKVATLDVHDTFNGVAQPWNSTTGWTKTGSGTAAIAPAGQLHLADSSGAPTSMSRSIPGVDAFAVSLRAQVGTYTADDPTAGVSLGLKVATGTRRLMLAFQGDGVYAITAASAPAWVKVYAAAGDTAAHTWKIVSDGSGQTSLSRDSGGPVVAAWQTPTNTATRTVELWTQGSTARPTDAHVDSINLSLPEIDENWDTTGGWSPVSSGGAAEENPSGQVQLLSNNAKYSSVTKLRPSLSAPYYLEFRLKVDTYTVNDPTAGTTLLVKVADGTKRLMLAVQGDGLWAITSTSAPAWQRVYAATGDTAWHTWSVRVDETGTTRVFRDGVSLGLSWDLAANSTAPQIQFNTLGTAAAPAEVHLDLARLTRPWF